MLDPVETQPTGLPARVAIHTRSSVSPPARLQSVAVEGQRVLIGLLWPAELETVPPYEFVTLVDLPPLGSGIWSIEAFATASPGGPRLGSGAVASLVVSHPLVSFEYAGPPRPSTDQEILLRFSHEPCSGRVELQGDGEGRRILLRGLSAGSRLRRRLVHPGRSAAGRPLADRARKAATRASAAASTSRCCRPRCCSPATSRWRSAGGTPPDETGSGHLVRAPSADSALFYFFSPDNWELMVKVLDGCAINGHYWVFGAASTDVGFRVDVRRRNSAQAYHFENPLGTAAKAITNIEAFPCALENR